MDDELSPEAKAALVRAYDILLRRRRERLSRSTTNNDGNAVLADGTLIEAEAAANAPLPAPLGSHSIPASSTIR